MWVVLIEYLSGIALFWCFLEIMRKRWMNRYLWMSRPSVSDLFSESIIQFTNESLLSQKLSGLLRFSSNNGLIPHKTTETTLRIIIILHSPHDVKTLFCGPPEAWKLQSPFCGSLFLQRHNMLKKVISQFWLFLITILSSLRKKPGSRDINSEVWDINSELHNINSELRYINSQFWEKKVRIEI